MAVNNFTSEPSPPATHGIADDGSVSNAHCNVNSLKAPNTAMKQTNPCNIHHTTDLGNSVYNSLSQASGKPIINALDINSLKWSFRTLSADFKRCDASKQGYVNSTAPYFTSRSTNQIISTDEWRQVRNIIAAFNSNTESITRGNVLTESFHNSLVSYYDSYKNGCLCNADCGCNSVCVCNSDCGCDYSDKRLKTNIKFHHEVILNDGIKVKFYTFVYTKEAIEKFNLSKEIQTGVIAQELLELGLDNCVSNTGKYYMVNYTKLASLYEE